MDRRMQKTRNDIFQAFLRLLHQKRYHNISVKDIIQEANVGRATFYNHFATKDDLLTTFCQNLFEHVFSEDYDCDIGNFYEKSKNLEQRLFHIFYHFKHSQKDMLSILKSDDANIFWQVFEPYLKKLFEQEIQTKNLPHGFLESFYIGSFIATIKWWIHNQMQESEESMAKNFMQAANLH